MNQYKDTTHEPNTLQAQNKPPIKRVIHGLLDCLLMAGMMLFVLILATHCQPAIAAYDEKSQVTKSHSLTCEINSPVLEKTSPVKQRSSTSQAMPKHCMSIR